MATSLELLSAAQQSFLLPKVLPDAHPFLASTYAAVDGVPAQGPPLSFCQFSDSGGYLCWTAERPSFVQGAPADMVFGCDSIPENDEPTAENCWCILGLGFENEWLEAENWCDCLVLPERPEMLDGIYHVAWDCRGNLEGPCVGQDPWGNCLSSDDPDAPGVNGFEADDGELQDCFINGGGTWSCLHKDQPLPWVPAPDSLLLVACDNFPENGPFPVNGPDPGDCFCSIYLASTLEEADFYTNRCSNCFLKPEGSSGDWNITWDCSDLLVGECVGRDFRGDCISNVEDILGDPAIGPDLDPCSMTQDGTYICYGSQSPTFVPDPSLFFVECDTEPMEEPSGRQHGCTCDIALTPSLEKCLCTIVPQKDLTDGQYAVAWDCRGKLEGSCVGQDPFGKCLTNDDTRPYASGFDAGNQLVDCFINGAGRWTCAFEQQPVSFVPAPESLLVVACDEYPVTGPDISCTCNIYLASSLEGANFNTNRCDTCSIIERGNGSWDVSWDCSNLLEGDCVGRDFRGECIASSAATPNSSP